MGGSPGDVSEAPLILQAFRRFTYVTAHSPTLPSLYLRHNSFSNPSVASPTSQVILQPIFRLSYVTGFSGTSPGEPPMLRGPILVAFYDTHRLRWGYSVSRPPHGTKSVLFFIHCYLETLQHLWSYRV